MVDLTKEINSILSAYADEVEQDLLEVEEAVAKDAVKKLKASSPKNPKNGGHKHYADGWGIDNESKKKYARYVIKNKQYRLTHLLENGHDLVRNGRKVGHVKAQPHIKPVEEWCKTEVEKRLRRELG